MRDQQKVFRPHQIIVKFNRTEIKTKRVVLNLPNSQIVLAKKD